MGIQFRQTDSGDTESALPGWDDPLRQTTVSLARWIRHMNKKTLGQIIKQKRLELCLRSANAHISCVVKASHVAYIESGWRKPSLTLQAHRRLTGLDRQEMFLLSHPEAKYPVNQSREQAVPTHPDPRRDRDGSLSAHQELK